MCIHVTRLCPGCTKPTDYREIVDCDKGESCPGIKLFKLPLRREHFAEWNCEEPQCVFNDEHLRSLEQGYVTARRAQREGNFNGVVSQHTVDGKLFISS
jgi:hypothetical protein